MMYGKNYKKQTEKCKTILLIASNDIELTEKNNEEATETGHEEREKED
jgi:hypothetical protein